MIIKLFKWFLTMLGAQMSADILWRFQMVVNYMKLGRWMASNDFRIARRLSTKQAVFDAVAEKVYEKQVLYLEFGVYKGDSMRYWSRVLEHPQSKLHGFDSFEGLPEDWDIEGPYTKGVFDTAGEIPHIADSRVHFFKGWFDKVLPIYQLPEYEVLVINLDADLYSSTKVCLNYLSPFIRPGTFIYFDNMNRPEHEPRAFHEFIKESRLSFRLVSTDYTLRAAFFECVKGLR